MQIPILSGIYTDNKADYRTSYPRNMVPVPKEQGISQGYLKPSEGIKTFIETDGIDRGGIVWNDLMYRVMGSNLYIIFKDGTSQLIGNVENDEKPVRFDYSFDILAICSNQSVYHYDGVSLTKVTDPDLGDANDLLWVDGYFMTTDGDNLVVSDLNDPTSINPLKYGSSEIDPDPVVAIRKVQGEVYAINRHTIEVFNNIGGALFPFQRVEGGVISRGAIGRDAVVVYDDALAFVGGGRNESIAVWVGINGSSQKVSTREIEQELQSYTEDELKSIILETRRSEGHFFLYIHLPDKTFVFDAAATNVLNKPVWFVLTSGVAEKGKYNARFMLYAYGNYYCGHPSKNYIGKMTNETQEQYGEKVTWSFGTQMIYNEGKGAIVNSLELVALSGRSVLSDNPQISTQYSLDGITYSQPKYISSGKIGQRLKRLVWRRQGKMNNVRTQIFSGDSDSFLSFSRLEANLEPLAW